MNTFKFISILKLTLLLLLINVNWLNSNQDYTEDVEFLRLIQQALKMEEKNDLEGAIKTNKTIVKKYPQAVEAYCTIAGIYGLLGNFEEEINWCKKALKVNPNYYNTYINLGTAYSETNKFELAKSTFQQAIKIESTNALGYYSLGYLYERNAKFNEAINYYKKALEIDPNMEDARINYGTSLANLNKHEESLEQLEIARKNNPDSEFILNLIKNITKDLKSKNKKK